MEVATILENQEKGLIYGLIGNIDLTTTNKNINIVKSYVFKDTVKEYINNEKLTKALKMVMLEENVLSKKGPELSESELYQVGLASSLIKNKEVIVLEYFEKGLNFKEKENFKRLFRKLAKDYNKTIVIYTNDITFLWDIADSIIHVDNGGVINTYKKEEYFNLLEIVENPVISETIDLIREKGIKIEDYKDVLDLLKAIYRIKEKEKNNEISN